MNIDWLDDGRKEPDEVMFPIWIMAVHAVRAVGLIAKACHFLIVRVFYRWLKQYDALESRMPS